MAGRRLLDAAKLFNASRSVAKQHIALRSQQLDVFNKTSTLAKAVKSQTDRVTLTAQAAIALSRRFNEPPSSYTNFATQKEQHTQPQDGAVPRSDSVTGESGAEVPKEGLQQDHHYDRSPDSNPAERPPEGELGVKQEKPARSPLPDGTIPPADSKLHNAPSGKDTYGERPQTEPLREPLSGEQQGDKEGLRPVESGASTIPIPAGTKYQHSADEIRRLQRQAEFHIPSQTAQPRAHAIPSDNAGLYAGHDKDVYYEPSADTQEQYSSLPRAKIPKHTENIQGSDEHVQDNQINPDVYYSPKGQQQKQQTPEQDHDDVPEGVNVDVFRSSKVSKMLSGKYYRGAKDRDQRVRNTQWPPVDRTVPSTEQGQDTFSVRESESTSSAKLEQNVQQTSNITPSQSDEDVHSLAADIANDTAAAPAAASEVTLADVLTAVEQLPADVATAPEKAPYQMRESRVPSSRFGRLWQYAGLGTSMAFGAVGEGLRRVTGGGMPGGSLMLSAGNMERLVAKLSRMRGAALKLGQMISFQARLMKADIKMLPKPIHDVLQRVQDSADYMPASQRNKVLASNLGSEWRDLFSSFEEVPMAAASIGQVHKAVLKSTGQEVAVKVQYPGVANSIDSDLSNLSILLTASRLLPKGLYLDKTIANARTELAWECDYIREAECQMRFRELISDEPDTFVVPAVIPEASGREVLTAELMTGTGVAKLPSLAQDRRDWIGTQILRLCLRETTEFKFMQTDPNWTNFLYNQDTHKLELLDFGASRDYPDHFIDPYVRVLIAASKNDKDSIRDLSIQLGYLTGHESQKMLDAHIASVLTLGEPFGASAPETYDFRDQTITDRVRELIPTMVRERLAPPPEETYSLHRKLSGAFLLCARLGARVRCRELFENAVKTWERRS
ncbi:hypothetical protein H2201_008129 [Coniosporium apollinis]|uniref:ABC1 atypical kinase-like domain-containing protein n=1 Tax=Coniosporium apollinis TaxID=61459 RepID=A0ABQ9NHU0_9PEZI|nr:hypothetical protein H2201_008129 [Coniosporium apollinis]